MSLATGTDTDCIGNRTYRDVSRDDLAVTESVAPLTIALPVAPDLPEASVRRVVAALTLSVHYAADASDVGTPQYSFRPDTPRSFPMRRVAILVAASPTSAFYSQVAVLNLALNRLHWSRWEPSLHVYIGGPSNPAALAQWAPHLRNVQVHWTSATRFALTGDWAQSDDVFMSAPLDADVFLAMDADTLPVDEIEPVLDRVLDTGAVAGVIAHYPTILPHTFDQGAGQFVVQPASDMWPDTTVRSGWKRLARGILEVPLEFSFSHTLMGADVPVEHREAPFYLNFGVVFFPKEAFDRIAPTYLEIRPQLMDRLWSSDFSGQAALTLAIASVGAKTWALPMRYNFPNDAIAEQLYPTELELAAVFHYLRTETFDRHQIFASAEQYRTFQALPLEGVNRRFQEAVRRIVGEQYPFA